MDLHDCLSLFTSNEQLSENDLWYCPTCKLHVQAFKKLDLWKLPNILVIHLKRFNFSKYSREKLTVKVEFPIDNLQLSEFVLNDVEKNTTYSLFAVSNHIGSIGGGHYTSYCKNHNDGEWYEYNDSLVSSLKFPQRYLSNNAYVLYYSKCTQK